MPEPPRAGDVVAGKYRIERPLGSGGMGVVVCATHLQLNQPVALKFLVDGALEAHVAAERFLREARATFRLRSEHAVRVMDVGTLPAGQPFIVMELLEGKDFKDLLAERGPLPPQEAVLYVLQVCAALQEAHALGIVHRDLKARNLFLTRRVDGSPCVKVLDFGISKVSGDEAPLTQPDIGMGSPRYMAPEQWVSASTVDARADVYGVGAVLYELLTGQTPLQGLPLPELIARLRAGAIPAARELRPEVPEALSKALMKALRPHPEERYPTAKHFAQALREATPDAENGERPPKPLMALTVPTAVVSREVLLAQAEIAMRLAAKDAKDEKDDEQELATIVQRGPMDATLSSARSVSVAGPESGAPPAAQRAAARVPQPAATLQVAEAPSEIRAEREQQRFDVTKASPRLAQPPTPSIPIELPIDPTLDEPAAVPRVPVAFAPSPHAARPLAPAPVPAPSSPAAAAASRPRPGIPAWLFWVLLVVSFCFAGGVAAALLTRWFQ